MEQDPYKDQKPDLPMGPFIEGSDDGLRSKTSLRMLYEAQVTVIQKQIGDLEQVRLGLGLSQRKMCQLLMVDPSAWTRWNRGEQKPPPHIWRALQWYISLQEKLPGLTPQYFIGKDPQILMSEFKTSFSGQIGELQRSAEALKLEVRFHRRLSYLMTGLTILMAAGLIIFSRTRGF
jgi:transcriptional regulator with XRE-family HTH domain